MLKGRFRWPYRCSAPVWRPLSTNLWDFANGLLWLYDLFSAVVLLYPKELVPSKWTIREIEGHYWIGIRIAIWCFAINKLVLKQKPLSNTHNSWRWVGVKTNLFCVRSNECKMSDISPSRCIRLQILRFPLQMAFSYYRCSWMLKVGIFYVLHRAQGYIGGDKIRIAINEMRPLSVWREL